MSGQEIYLSADQFGANNVKEMKESDFWLGSATPTAIKDPRVHIILFYEPSSIDPGIIDIWNLLAKTKGGPIIAAVNVSARTEVMEAFTAVAGNLDNPLYDYQISGYPTILVYRSRWPQAYYNGEISYDAINKWIVVLAVQPGYRERDSTFRGVRAVASDTFVTDTRIEGFPYPTSSRDFNAFIGEVAGPRGSGSSFQGGQGSVNEQVQNVGFIDEFQ